MGAVAWLLLAALPGWGAGPAPGPFPLRIEGQRLLDAGGREFRVAGDAAWSLIVALTPAEADHYLASRQAAGFNAVLVELIERGYTGPADRQGNVPFPDGRPFSAPSPAYFAQARLLLDLALQRHFLVLLAPAYVGYQCTPKNWCDGLRAASVAELEAYGRYVGAQLAGYPNLIWVHGGDVDARPYGLMGKVEAVYRGIAAADPDSLHTAHCSRNFSAIDCYERPWLDLNTTYSDCELTLAKVRLDGRRAPAMPSLYIEGRYEEERSTPRCVRAQIWWSYLGGSVGHVFGNKRIWPFEPDWRNALATPGTRAMTVAARLLGRLAPGERLEPVAPGASPLTVLPLASAAARLAAWPVPVADVAAAAAGTDGIAVARSAGRVVAYLPAATRFGFAGPEPVRCWVDPRTGQVTPASEGGAGQATPGAGDWLFVAERERRLCAGDLP